MGLTRVPMAVTVVVKVQVRVAVKPNAYWADYDDVTRLSPDKATMAAVLHALRKIMARSPAEHKAYTKFT